MRNAVHCACCLSLNGLSTDTQTSPPLLSSISPPTSPSISTDCTTQWSTCVTPASGWCMPVSGLQVLPFQALYLVGHTREGRATPTGAGPSNYLHSTLPYVMWTKEAFTTHTAHTICSDHNPSLVVTISPECTDKVSAPCEC